MEGQDNDLSQMKKRICFRTIALAIVASGILLFLQEKGIARGLLLGTLFSVVNFLLLSTSIPMTLWRSRSQASWIGFGSILTRYAMLAVPMVVGLKSSSFSFFAVVVGVFSVQLFMFFEYLVIRPILEGR
jgi:hypothetical protein